MSHVKWESNPNTLVQGVGEHAYAKNWAKLVGKLPKDKELKEQVDVQLVAEPNNAYDSTAVALQVRGIHVGYLPREYAAVIFHHVKPLADRGDTVSIPGSIWAVQRSDGLKSNVSLYIPDDLLEGFGKPTSGTRSVQSKTSGYKPNREWWTAAGVAFILCLIPVVGVILGLIVFCVFGFLITSGRFNYSKQTFWKKK